MNKLLFSAGLVAAFASPLLLQSASAQDNQSGSNSPNGIDYTNPMNDYFVDGNLGQSQYRNGASHNDSVFQNVRFGWRWNGIVGAEIGYAYLGRPKNVINTPYIQRQSWVQNRAATIGVNAKYNFYQNWFVTAHGGYMRSQSKTQVNYNILGVSVRDTDWNNGWYAGAGVGYDVTPNVSLSLNYDNYHVEYQDQPGYFRDKNNIAAFSAGAEIRF